MPHGAMDSYTYLQRVGKFYLNGNQVQYSNNVFKDGTTRYPASVSNPLIFGYRAPSGYYTTVFRWETSECALKWDFPLYGLVYESKGQLSSYEQPHQEADAQLDPSLATEVLNKCLSQMLEDDVAFNAFMLQGKQSLRMVADLATGIAHGTDKLMIANFKRPKSFRKFLANAGDKAISNFSSKYLEYLYGWKPLADDVENAFQSMIDGYTGPEQKTFRMRVRKSKKTTRDLVVTRPVGAYWTENWSYEQTMIRENRAKVVLNYQFPSQAGEMLPTMTPFGTAWELAPWSFVVDWFIPVGDWIGAMEATQYAVYMHAGVLTQSVKVTSQPGSGSSWTHIQTAGAGSGCTYTKPPVSTGQSFIMTREVLSRLDVLDRIRFPDFSSKFGLPQASQALALLSQVLKKWF